MNILFVVPYVPNLVRTRPYNLVRTLSERGHHITVLTLWTNEQEQHDVECLRHQCAHVQALHMPVWRSLLNSMLALPSEVPLQSVFSWRPELVAGLNGNTAFDLIHVEHLRGARYALRLRSQSKLPIVWDSVDCISHLFRQAAIHSQNRVGRLRSRFELRRTEKYEGWLLDKFDHVLVTSPVDQKALASLSVNGRPAPISVLENGVDLSYFQPDTAVSKEPATLVVSGKMSYHANISMAVYLVRHIMPHVWMRRPDVRVCLVGKDPTKEVLALAQNPAVVVTGTVADIRPYLRRATMAVSPLTYGAGMQNKVLEAMACATPVIATSQAVSALDVVPGRDVLVADGPVAFAEMILHLLEDPVRQQQLGQAGRRYVEAHHHWPTIATRLEEIYHNIIRKKAFN